MHEVYVCFGCRVPLVEGCFGMFCCELCKILWSRRVPTVVRMVPSRLHSAECIQRLREMLMRKRSFVVLSERVVPMVFVSADGETSTVD